MQISIKANVKILKKELGWIFKKQIPFITKVTLGELVEDSMWETRKQLQSHLDSPTPWTIKSVQFEHDKDIKNLSSKVGFAGQGFGQKREKAYDSPNEYMNRLITGGTRRPKKKQVGVPTPKEKFNKAGNVRRSAIRDYMGDDRFFSGVPKGRDADAKGIYRRLGKGGKDGLRRLWSWKNTTYYKAIFPFARIVNNRVGKVLQKKFQVAFNKAMEPRKKKKRRR